MSQTDAQIAGLTDADFRRTVLRAMRLTAIMLAVGVPLVWWKLGWPSAIYLLLGGVISGSSLWQGLRLMTVVMRQMDAQNPPDAQNQTDAAAQRTPSLTPCFPGAAAACRYRAGAAVCYSKDSEWFSLRACCRVSGRRIGALG